MKSTIFKPGGKLLSFKQASAEYGLPEALLRDLAARGEISSLRPPHIRRVFLLRASLEQAIDRWRAEAA